MHLFNVCFFFLDLKESEGTVGNLVEPVHPNSYRPGEPIGGHRC